MELKDDKLLLVAIYAWFFMIRILCTFSEDSSHIKVQQAHKDNTKAPQQSHQGRGIMSVLYFVLFAYLSSKIHIR